MRINCTYAGKCVGGPQASLHRERTVHVTSASFLGRSWALSASMCSQTRESKVYTRWNSLTRAHSAGSETTIAAEEGKPAFLDELRQYAMKLHTREQAPKEGQAKAPKQQKQVCLYAIELMVQYLHVLWHLFCGNLTKCFFYFCSSLHLPKRDIFGSWRSQRLCMIHSKI